MEDPPEWLYQSTVGLVFQVLRAAIQDHEVLAVVVVVVAGQLFYYKMGYCKAWLPAAVAAAGQVILAQVAAVLGPTAKLPQGSMVNQEQVIQVTAALAEVVAEDTMAALAEVAMVEHMAGGRVLAILVDKQETLAPAGVLPIQMDLIPVVEHPADSQESQYRLELDKAGDQTANVGAMDMQ